MGHPTRPLPPNAFTFFWFAYSFVVLASIM
jgi:hypothetical protein